MYKTPIAIFGFNKPQYVRRLLKILEKVEPSKLYLFCDGARNDEEQKKVKETQEAFLKKLPWNVQVETVFRDSNWGLAKSLSQGISEVFNVEEELVILEDDIVPDQSFFYFCQEMLEKYKDENIGQITGHCPLVNSLVEASPQAYPYSYYYSRYCLVWGWATWKNKWKDFKFAPEELIKVIDHPNFNNLFPKLSEREVWIKDIKSLCKSNDRSKWALRWNISNWMMGRLTVVPTVNLCSHNDNSNQSTHVHRYDCRNNVPTQSLILPLKHPPKIEQALSYDESAEKIHFHMNTGLRMQNIAQRYLRQFGILKPKD